MKLGMTTGGANYTAIFLITGGTVASTPAIIFNRTVASNFGNRTNILLGKTGGTLTLDNSGNSSEVTDFLSANVSDATEAPTTEYFEDGSLDTVGSSSVLGAIAVTYGGVDSGEYQVVYGTVTISVGDLAQSHNTRTKSNIVLTYTEWNGSGDLTLPATLWNDTLLDTVSPSPALPTSLAVGTASVETWLKSA